MNTEWHNFLRDRGAWLQQGQRVMVESGKNSHLSIDSWDILADLNLYGLIKISGEDAASFLQNLLSNDIKELDSGCSQLSSFCTAKGRAIALFRLFKIGEAYYLRLPYELIETLLKRLQMYVLMSKVSLQTEPSWIACGIAGTGATASLERHLSIRIDQVDRLEWMENGCVIRVPGNERYEIYAPLETMQVLWPKLHKDLQLSNSAGWRLLDIRNGIAQIYAATSEHFIPQMMNLELVGGVSFKKGCYPGQEVVARMQYLGKLKRRMYHVQIEATEAPAPGSAIVAVDNDKTHEAGEIVDACAVSETVEALAVLPIASTRLSLHVGSTNGAPLRLLKLPYRFPAGNESE